MTSRTLLLLSLFTTTLAANHDILAGQAGLYFTPNVTTAAVGDTLTFHFYPGKHNVVRGAFDIPCNYTGDAFYSGFIVPSVGESDHIFTVTLNDTEPIWYYCSKWMHCQLGMVGVVNPPATDPSLADYAVAAAKTTFNSTTPPFVAGGILSTISNASPTTSIASNSSATGSITPSSTQGKSEGSFMGGANVVLSGLCAMLAVGTMWAGLI